MGLLNNISFLMGLWLLSALPFLNSNSYGFESDQWAFRQIPLRDSTAIINRKSQELLNNALAQWTDRDASLARVDIKAAERKLFSLIFTTVSGPLPTGHLETWLALTNEVDSQDVRVHSVYYNGPVAAVHLNGILSSCANIRLAGVRIGTDKVRHFFALGAKYYRRVVLQGLPEQEALAFGENTERTYFGFWVSGVYSNADLVANYEGYIFFKSLFNPTENVAGEHLPPMIAWRDGWPQLQRPFRWENHVSSLWDEALFPSFFQPPLQLYINGILTNRFCFNYRLNPQSFEMNISQHDIEHFIQRRYGGIRFLYNWQNRLDSLCQAVN